MVREIFCLRSGQVRNQFRHLPTVPQYYHFLLVQVDTVKFRKPACCLVFLPTLPQETVAEASMMEDLNKLNPKWQSKPMMSLLPSIYLHSKGDAVADII